MFALLAALPVAFAAVSNNTVIADNSTETSTAAAANGTDATVTSVVTEFTTYCPEPTTFVAGNKTYTVTAPTTLTITDCPCTIEPTKGNNGTSVPAESTGGKPTSGPIPNGAGVAAIAAVPVVVAVAALL